MIVRLTAGTYATLRQTALPPEITEALDEDVHGAVPGAVLVRMPYIAWAVTREHLVRRTFTAGGARDRSVPAYLASALRNIQQAINVRDRHPALRSLAATGRQVDLIPAWVGGWGSYCPRPNGGHFVVLQPHIDRSRRLGMDVTRWTAREPSPGDDWCCQEASHLRFWPHAREALHWSPDVYGAGVEQ